MVILEEEEVVRVAMVSRPLSMEVSPKFCQRRKQMHLSQNNAMYQISHTMQLNKEQFVRQKSAKRYHIFKADTILFIMYDSKSKPWKLFCMLLCHRS